MSREGPDGNIEYENIQRKVKGDKTFFKTEFKLVEYHGTVLPTIAVSCVTEILFKVETYHCLLNKILMLRLNTTYHVQEVDAFFLTYR